MINLDFKTFNPILNIQGAYAILAIQVALLCIMVIVLIIMLILKLITSPKAMIRNMVYKIDGSYFQLKDLKIRAYNSLLSVFKKLKKTIFLEAPLLLIYEEVI